MMVVKPIRSSANWRFLPGMPASGAALVAGSGEGLAGIFQPLLQLEHLAPQPGLHPPATFSLIAFPSGLPHPSWFPLARRWLRPAGVLYLGFGSGWGGALAPGRQPGLKRLARLLRRAGFAQVTAYGAVPDAAMATYMFPLQGEAISFALCRYFAGRRLGQLWSRLGRPALCQRLALLLPAFALVAQVASPPGPEPDRP